jgi:hypothetical protein
MAHPPLNHHLHAVCGCQRRCELAESRGYSGQNATCVARCTAKSRIDPAEPPVRENGNQANRSPLKWTWLCASG